MASDDALVQVLATIVFLLSRSRLEGSLSSSIEVAKALKSLKENEQFHGVKN